MSAAIIELLGRMRNLYGPPRHCKTDEDLRKVEAEYRRPLDTFKPTMDDVNHAWPIITEGHRGASWPSIGQIMKPMRDFRARYEAKAKRTGGARTYNSADGPRRRQTEETPADRQRFSEMMGALRKFVDTDAAGDLQLILFNLHKERGQYPGWTDVQFWELARPTRPMAVSLLALGERKVSFDERVVMPTDDSQPDLEGFA